jgi:diadenosine tetraphosphate (Ap4A) HIT family hydrolase
MPVAENCPLCQKVANLNQLPENELVWEFPNSVAMLGPWQFFQGYCVLVAKRHVTELFEQTQAERHAILDEVATLAQAIHQVVRPRKINYEFLGNQVPHLHWHLFPRQEFEPNKLQAVWVELEKARLDMEQKRRLESCSLGRAVLINALRNELDKLVKL